MFSYYFNIWSLLCHIFGPKFKSTEKTKKTKFATSFFGRRRRRRTTFESTVLFPGSRAFQQKKRNLDPTNIKRSRGILSFSALGGPGGPNCSKIRGPKIFSGSIRWGTLLV
jgi:hypothetical protein